jgi:hypothetical protein
MTTLTNAQRYALLLSYLASRRRSERCRSGRLAKDLGDDNMGADLGALPAMEMGGAAAPGLPRCHRQQPQQRLRRYDVRHHRSHVSIVWLQIQFKLVSLVVVHACQSRLP